MLCSVDVPGMPAIFWEEMTGGSGGEKRGRRIGWSVRRERYGLVIFYERNI